MNQTTKFFFLLIFIFTSEIIKAQYQIGHYNITFQDPSRSNRNIETEIFYPANSQGQNVSVALGQFPVIVFGHGFVIPYSDYQALWEEFVPDGYIMAFPLTEGGLLSTNHQEFGWDLQFLVDKIQEEGSNNTSPIYNAVSNSTALMGHSMGGGAIFLAADSLCTNENEHLKTIIALAPAESSSNGVSSIISANNITVPSIIFSGSQDGVTPPDEHHIPMYNNLSSNCRTFISISGGAHCYFANSNLACDLGESLSSNGISISREEQQAITFDFLNLWLSYTLNDSCSNLSIFQDSLTTSNRITYNQSCLQDSATTILHHEGILTSSVIGSEYQWYLNGNVIPQANEISYTPIISGQYIVELFFSNDCPTMSNPYDFTFQFNNLQKFFPIRYGLQQNHPNPFNPITSLRYNLPEDGLVNITVYDMVGRIVKTLVNGSQTAGFKLIQWNATNDRNEPVSAGLYLYSIQAGEFRQTKKMVLLK